MVSVSPYHDKKVIFFLYGPSIKKTIYLALIRQSLLRYQPEGLCIVCWTTQTIVGTLTFTVLVIFTSVQPYFLYKAPAHIHSLKRHPLILWCWSSKCVCGFVPRHIILCLFTPLSIQVNRSAVTARTDSVHTYSWTYFYSLLSTTFVLSREVTFWPLFSDRPNEHLTPGYLLAFETFPVTDDVMNGVEPRPSYVCVWAKFV